MSNATTATTESAQRTRYDGPDRRRHRVFVTRNSEYHCRDEICVAVRDLRSGALMFGHRAVGRRMTASFKLSSEGGIESKGTVEEVRVGEQLCFASADGDRSLGHDEILTSPVRAIERPPKEVVVEYVH